MQQFFVLFIALIIISSCSNVNDVNDDQSLESESENIKTIITDFPDISAANTVTGTWVGVGSPGHGKDISVSGVTPYKIGSNNLIYYFNGSSWVLEPGGGHGKMISSTGSTLFKRGSNDKIYTKSKGSGSWSKLVDEEVRSISAFSGSFNTTSLQTATLGSSWSGGGYIPLEYNDSGNLNAIFPGEYTPSRSYNVSSFKVEEIVRASNSVYYAAGFISEDFPNPGTYLGHGIFKLGPNSNTWVEVGGRAKDIAVSQSHIWIIGGDNNVYRKSTASNNEPWEAVTGHGKRISVSPSGQPYKIGSNNRIYKFVED